MKNGNSSFTLKAGASATLGPESELMVCRGNMSGASETSRGWTREGFELDPWSGIKTGGRPGKCVY